MFGESYIAKFSYFWKRRRLDICRITDDLNEPFDKKISYEIKNKEDPQHLAYDGNNLLAVFFNSEKKTGSLIRLFNINNVETLMIFDMKHGVFSLVFYEANRLACL